MPETPSTPVETVLDADDYDDDTWECRLCAAPGGFPYCNDACRDADSNENVTQQQ